MRLRDTAMTKTDKKLFIGILFFGLIVFFINKYAFSSQSGAQAVIKVQGNVVQTVNLNEDTGAEPIIVQGKLGTVIIEVKDKKVRISEATCPDQICVKQGWISSPAQSIICVPNELVIYINEKPPVDAITR